MTRTFVPLRRIAALSVAITLVAAPIASAQSLTAAPPAAAQTNAAVLSPVAFARLVQGPSAEAASVPVVAESPRPKLLRQAQTIATRQAQAAAPAAQQPKQRSWVARHKVVTGILIGVGGFFSFVAMAYAGVFGD